MIDNVECLRASNREGFDRKRIPGYQASMFVMMMALKASIGTAVGEPWQKEGKPVLNEIFVQLKRTAGRTSDSFTCHPTEVTFQP